MGQELVHCMPVILVRRLRCIQCFMEAAKSVHLDLGEYIIML